MFPVETFNAIKNLAQAAQLPTRTKINEHTFVDAVPGKDPVYVLAVPSAVHRSIHRLEDFAQLLESRKEGLYMSEGVKIPDGDIPNVLNVGNEGSVCYFNLQNVQYHETPGDLRGFRANMDMVKTPQMVYLMAEPKIHSHPEFVRLLRITLRDCLPATNLLSIIREVKFNNGSAIASVQQNTRQSISRDLQAEVTGLQAIPEEVTLSVQPFENLKNKFNVQCAIETDATTGTFKLTPYPGQLVDAIDAAMTVISMRLNLYVPSYYGAHR